MPDEETAAAHEPAAAHDTATTMLVNREPTRRRRAPIVIGIVLVVLVLLVIGYFVAENYARQQISARVTDEVQTALGTKQPVDVTIAGVSVIAQAVTGSLDRVDIGVDDVSVGELSGDVKLVATSIPVDLSQPVKAVNVEFIADESSVQSLVDLAAGGAAGGSVGDVSLVDGEIKLDNEYSIFGLTLTVSIGVVPSAQDGKVAFAPSSIAVNGATLTAEELEDRFGSVVDSLVQKRTVCIADRLPAPLKLSDLQVDGKTIVLTLDAKKVVLDQATLGQLGTCS